MLDYADLVAINKFEKPRSEDAYRDVVKQYLRNRQQFAPADKENAPIYATMASQFNDPGVNALFSEIVKIFSIKNSIPQDIVRLKFQDQKQAIIPVSKVNYLRAIADCCNSYAAEIEKTALKLEEFESFSKTSKVLKSKNVESKNVDEHLSALENSIEREVFEDLNVFDHNCEQYKKGIFSYQVRGNTIDVVTKYESLSGLKISRVSVPQYSSAADKYRFIKKYNLPGFFPYSAGIFPFKRKDEDPKRMFAGEGGPNRTNKRFHYLSKADSFKRLSTAFDSVTLYGEDPDKRPDIYGKIGESGVSIATLTDMQSLFDGFDLTAPSTSVSMTINGPAPIILAMFMNTAVKQKLGSSHNVDLSKKIEIMRQVRGTVQADILKEDQAQNTCIFSLNFALKMMGDVQDFFSKNKIQNYYTVSISGYHIAEAGANPITQLAFTLANGFTYLEYYLSRGLHVDEICPNLSYFFSNGLDPEYTVIGSVARKIWAVTLREKYKANIKSQQFKYHVQTSGRSLHAQEIDFNDIRTTLQAFLALSDNCNSLHTNAFDEAITTPTEESVRRAMAVQMIINKEFGLNKTDNPLQGSFIFNEMSELVESAVLKEFERISDKGGVLGAMEVQYQRSKIQEESLHYETLKDNGSLPIIGVNTYLAENAKEQIISSITRASYDEKNAQIERLNQFKKDNQTNAKNALEKLRIVALSGGNIFEELLDTVNYCSLGQISQVLYQAGGSYRRNM
jgi:methylmalonyl-CoA mutase